MFGEEDSLLDRPYSSQITCRSNIGSVFAIRGDEFLRKIKPNVDSWRSILLMAMVKEKVIFDRVRVIRKIIMEKMKSKAEVKNIK